MAVDVKDSSYRCDPNDIALKSFFLGPQSENARWFKEVIDRVLEGYITWRQGVYPDDGCAISNADANTPEFRQNRKDFLDEVQGLLGRFESEVPKFSPRYIGHMFSETSMPAMVGHVITLLHNPNNISGESSRVGVDLEREAVAALAQMLDMDDDQARGHFTSGGTVANFEAMVRARQRMVGFLTMGAQALASGVRTSTLFDAAHLGWKAYDELKMELGEDAQRSADFDFLKENPYVAARRLQEVFGEDYTGPVILVPEHKHYSWVKGVGLMGLGEEAFWAVRLDEQGVMNVDHLKERIEEARSSSRPVMMVVSVAGTTELGAFDPVGEVQDLLDAYARDEGIHIWHHVDAAYGGFLASNVCGGHTDCVMAPGVCHALASISRVNSVTLDPHKLGYVPYSSGTFIASRRREYYLSTVDAPYLSMDHNRDPGPQTIEGSRSAAGAVATWLTARTIGLNANGYGRILRRTISARHRMEDALWALDVPVRIIPASSNLLAFCVAYDGEPLSVINERSARIYEAFSPYRESEFFVSRTTLRFSAYGELLEPFMAGWNGERDTDEVMMIRLSLMNPFIESRETKTDFPAAFAASLAQVVEG